MVQEVKGLLQNWLEIINQVSEFLDYEMQFISVIEIFTELFI